MSAAMTWRRQPGRDGATRSSRSTCVKRTGRPPARQLAGDVAAGEGGHGEQPPQAATGEERGGDHRRSTWALTAWVRRRVDVADDLGQPVAVRGQLDELGAGAGGSRSDGSRRPRRRPPRSVRCTAAVTRTSRRRPVAGSTTSTQPDRWHVELARVVDDDRQEVVAQAEAGERIEPRRRRRSRTTTATKPRRLRDRADPVDGAGEVGRGRGPPTAAAWTRWRGWRAPGRARGAAASP